MTAFAYTNQRLRQHSEKTMEYALKFSSKDYAEVCAKRINAASKKKIISADEFMELVKISALMHDTGKAADKYQEQFEGTLCENPSFYLHEIPSAMIAKSLMEESGYDKYYVFLVSIAILLHHTAMRSFDEQEISLGNSKNNGWIFRGWKKDLDEISSALFKRTSPLNCIEAKKAKSFLDWIRRIAGDNEECRFAKLYCLILSPVIYGDNIDAKSRGGRKRSLFSKELEEITDG